MSKIKLNLNYAKPNSINGYINIFPFNQENKSEDLIYGDIINLDYIADQGEISEILCLEVIEYIPYNKIYEVISGWVGKLRVGGQLILGFLETEELCNLYHRGNINHNDFNKLIHGDTESNKIKLSSFSAPILIENLTKQHTIKLKKHTLNGIDVTLTFERYK